LSEPLKEPRMEGKPGEYLQMFSSPEQMEEAIGKCRLAAEQDTGVPMQLKGTRQTHYHDAEGRDIYEIWATFEPIPVPPVKEASDTPTSFSNASQISS
jgi:hypothetical protein